MNYLWDFFDGRGLVRGRFEFSAANDGEALRISVSHIVRDPRSDRQSGYELGRDALRLRGSRIGWQPGKLRQRKLALGRLWFARRADRWSRKRHN